MDPDRIEQSLRALITRAGGAACPGLLAQAIHDAVFPAGGRLRPRLCLTIAGACGDRDPMLADGAAAAVELLHCASLVHDDLPCFDDSEMRRGRPSIHSAYGQPIAVLAGDALIVLAFEAVIDVGCRDERARIDVLRALAAAAGAPSGLVAGQAWESEPEPDLRRYHGSKTGALFEAAAMVGAIAGGGSGMQWRPVGALLGEAYQYADDLADALGDPKQLGKPVGKDCVRAAPSLVEREGVVTAVRALDRALQCALDAVPACGGRDRVIELITAAATRLCPSALLRQLPSLRLVANEGVAARSRVQVI
ncbi:MAG: polyprenyl synthetase family protein [Deltaproteobacteria bacterium]|nr:polyprenyl synthetase family protein [Deltaproteobacteria bacterium]